MTQEEKQLLIKDLCARLPYRFFVHRYGDYATDIRIDNISTFGHFLEYSEGEDFKPYLRPMTSMTIDEKMEWFQMTQKHSNMSGFNELLEMADFTSESLDWLNKHHFDYRGLIEKGLALEATKDMYKTE